MDDLHLLEQLSIRVSAYTKSKTVSEILQVLTKEETEEIFEALLEEMIQAGRIE